MHSGCWPLKHCASPPPTGFCGFLRLASPLPSLLDQLRPFRPANSKAVAWSNGESVAQLALGGHGCCLEIACWTGLPMEPGAVQHCLSCICIHHATCASASVKAPKKPVGKKVASTPSAVKKATAPAKQTNPLFEKRTKNFGEQQQRTSRAWAAILQEHSFSPAASIRTRSITAFNCARRVLSLPCVGLGGVPPPKADLHRFVKWPKYVRLQRQKRVLSMRLKVPPAINQFMTKTLDKNQAETLFKLLLKYRPEDKKQKTER